MKHSKTDSQSVKKKQNYEFRHWIRSHYLIMSITLKNEEGGKKSDCVSCNFAIYTHALHSFCRMWCLFPSLSRMFTVKQNKTYQRNIRLEWFKSILHEQFGNDAILRYFASIVWSIVHIVQCFSIFTQMIGSFT